MFVDRLSELKRLESVYKLCLKGLRCGVLVYGWRKVGKTTLVRRFLENFEKKIYINCSWFPNPKSFAEEVHRFIRELSGDEKANEFIGKIDLLADQEKILIETLKALSEIGKNDKIPIALDEFHIFLERVTKKIAKVKGNSSVEVKRNILWLLKDLVERCSVFWILLSSIGWKKLQELMLLKGREEPPIVGVFEKLEVKPLNLDASIELAIKVNDKIDHDKAEIIARISGGIPPIIITIASTYRVGSIIKHAVELTRRGMFDDFFINIIKFIAELSRRDYNTYISVLKQLSRGKETIREISKAIGVEPPAIHEVLKELIKHGVIEKRGKKYIFNFPLLKTWLQVTKELSVEEEYESILTLLGIAAESYVRELLNEARGKVIIIKDDQKGKYLAGTTKSLELEIEEVLNRREATKFLRGTENGDIIVKTREHLYVIEVKATTRPITEKTIRKLISVVEKLKSRHPEAKGILIQLGTGEITLPAITQATKNEIVIITREGIRLLAKKLNYPKP